MVSQRYNSMGRLLCFSSQRSCAILLGVCLATGTTHCSAEDASQNFVARWRDGTTLKASELQGWKSDEKPPDRGKPSNIDGATISGRRLFDPNDPVRSLRFADGQTAPIGPFVELANGDILTGTVIPISNAYSTSESTRFLSVAVSDPLATKLSNNVVRFHRDATVRIVLTDAAGRSTTPGLIVFRDGRKVIARQIHWTPGGIRFLSESSVESAAWDELADVHASQPDHLAAFQRDSATSPNGELDILGRMSTKGGAVLTYHCDRVFSMKAGQDHYHLLQPSWAENGILVPIDEIALIVYCDADEVPLSLLPAQTLAERRLTGFAGNWRRNRNVRGEPLSVGGRPAEMGVGTHSHSEVAFDLPTEAVSFSCWVGIDDSVGPGGCVRCKIFRDEIAGAPAWASGIIRGGDKPVRVEITDLAKAQRLVLVTEFAHDDRPTGTDPLDIRDAVSWLDTSVRVNRPELRDQQIAVTDVVPELLGWSMTDSMKRRISFRTHLDEKQGRWAPSMVLDAKAPTEPVQPLVLTRDVNANIGNAWLLASSGRDAHGSIGYRVTVDVDGEIINGTEGYNGNTTGYKPGDFDRVAYSLGKYQGKRVKITVKANPAKDDRQNLCGILWDELSLTPLIEGLPASTQPFEPDVKIESVASFRLIPKKGADGQVTDFSPADSPPTLRHFRMASGLDIPPEFDSVTCQLDQRWERFVACVGPAGQSNGVMQSFQVWVGNELLWESKRFTRLSRAQQVDLRLPSEKAGKLLTLRVVNETRNHATWANAGFMLE